MTDQIILTVPEAISELARELALQADKPAEQILLEHLTTLGLPPLPPDEQAELDALHHLSDDALWTIAREQMSDAVQARADVLLDKSSHRVLSEIEQVELDALVERADRLIVRKAEAAAILQGRGHLFTQQDFRPN